MKKPIDVDYWQYKKTKCKFEIFTADSFENLTNVTQVYGIVVDNKNRILLVSGKGIDWILPGGGVEKGERLVDTLIREVYEESAIHIDKKFIKPFFYQRAYILKNNEWVFDGVQVRFLSRIKKQEKFVKDPDCGDIEYQKFVSVKNLDKFLDWGSTTKFIQNNIFSVL